MYSPIGGRRRRAESAAAEAFVDYVLSAARPGSIAATGWQPMRPARWAGRRGPAGQPGLDRRLRHAEGPARRVPRDLRWLTAAPARRGWPGIGVPRRRSSRCCGLVGWPLARLAGVAVEGGPGPSSRRSPSRPRRGDPQQRLDRALWWRCSRSRGRRGGARHRAEDLPRPAAGCAPGMLLPLVCPPFVSAVRLDAGVRPARPDSTSWSASSMPGLYGPRRDRPRPRRGGDAARLADRGGGPRHPGRARPRTRRPGQSAPDRGRRSGPITLPLLRPALVVGRRVVPSSSRSTRSASRRCSVRRPGSRRSRRASTRTSPGPPIRPRSSRRRRWRSSWSSSPWLVVGPADALLDRRPTARTEPAGPVPRSARRARRLPAAILAAAIVGAILVPLGRARADGAHPRRRACPRPGQLDAGQLRDRTRRAVRRRPGQQPDPGDDRGHGRPARSGGWHGRDPGTRSEPRARDGRRARLRRSGVGPGRRRPARVRRLDPRLAGDHPRGLRGQVLGASVIASWPARSIACHPTSRAPRGRAAPGPIDALRSVVWPALRRPAAAGWLIVFLFALHELTMSSLLYGPGTAPLAVVVLDVQQLGDPTVSAGARRPAHRDRGPGRGTAGGDRLAGRAPAAHAEAQP